MERGVPAVGHVLWRHASGKVCILVHLNGKVIKGTLRDIEVRGHLGDPRFMLIQASSHTASKKKAGQSPCFLVHQQYIANCRHLASQPLIVQSLYLGRHLVHQAILSLKMLFCPANKLIIQGVCFSKAEYIW